ncbi:MAG: nucleotidyltransferase domain-containing protein [Thermoguttaceae bacterium]|nr:nucleotidyltransferase domain-containing protein [Thermoguttaceae bacterium]MDW8078690.1 nucleotidyltransferase domain-containing protein [Thermoguttaceae bacterium]
MDEIDRGNCRQEMSAEECIAEMVSRIVRQFDPEQVILFGSRARGDADPESDFDLLVVMDYCGSAREVRLAMRQLLADLPVAKDIYVVSPDEFAWRRHVVGTLEYPAAQEGKVLYARPGKGNSGGQGMGSEGGE